MLYIASAITPTPVIDSVRVDSFTGPNTSSLVIAKPDRVEVWDITAKGLDLRAELQFWGTVVSIAKAEGASHLLVLTSPPNAQIHLLSFSSSLIVDSTIPLHPPTPSLRQAEYCRKVITKGNVAIVSLWTGVLSCIEIGPESESKKRRPSVAVDPGKLTLRDNFNINIREHNLLDIVFLPTSPSDSVAFLWQSSNEALLLQTREVSLLAHGFNDSSTSVNLVTPLRDVDIPDAESFDFNEIPFSCPAARHLLPISDEHILVMGDEHSVLYQLGQPTPPSPKVHRGSISSVSGIATSPRASAIRRSPQNEMSAPGKRRKSSMGRTSERWELKPVWRARQGFGVILSSTLLETHQSGGSVLLSDESGQLTALGWELEKESFGVKGTVHLSKVDFGKTSPASALTYLDSSHVFVASAYGDSVLARLKLQSSSSPESPQSPTTKAIPIRKGKAKARTSEDGSEWVVCLVEGKGSLEVKERWANLAPLRDIAVVGDEGGGVSHLLAASGASTSNSLRIIRSGVGLERTLSMEGVTDVTGIFPLATGSGHLLVTTGLSSFLFQLDGEVLMVDQEIASLPTLAASGKVVVNARGVHLCQEPSLSPLSTYAARSEIIAASCQGTLVSAAMRGGDVIILSVTDSGFEEKATIKTSSEVSSIAILESSTPVIAVATWSSEILLYSLDRLDNPVTLTEQYHAVSLIFSASAQLIAGLGDGTMVVYELEQANVASRKVSSLGSRPLQLFPTQGLGDGEENIIAVAVSERMSVVFEGKGRVEFSAVSKKDVTAAAAVQGGLVLATPTGLSFERVTSLKKLSIQTMDLAERSPIKVVSIPEHRLIGVGSASRRMNRESGDVIQKSQFELRDQNTLELLVEMQLGNGEEVTSLSHVFLLGRFYVVVGTAIISEEDDYSSGSVPGATGGRLHLVEPRRSGDTWEIGVKATYDTAGPVHDFEVIHGFLAVAAGSKVLTLALDPDLAGFREVGSFASTFIASRLAVVGALREHLVVGDGMRSVFVLDVDETDGGIYLDQRDLATHRVTAMEGLQDGGDGVIIADGHSNLLTLRLNGKIESAASFGLHEDISAFRTGSLVPASSAPEVINPEILFATADGRLGIVGELTHGATRTLSDLQRNMAKYIKGPGGVEWNLWRRGGTELIQRETAGFIDGDFIQRFLDMDSKEAFEGTNQHERVMKMQGGKAVAADMADVIGMLQAVGGLH